VRRLLSSGLRGQERRQAGVSSGFADDDWADDYLWAGFHSSLFGLPTEAELLWRSVFTRVYTLSPVVYVYCMIVLSTCERYAYQ
jgi:hypothetical protein